MNKVYNFIEKEHFLFEEIEIISQLSLIYKKDEDNSFNEFLQNVLKESKSKSTKSKSINILKYNIINELFLHTKHKIFNEKLKTTTEKYINNFKNKDKIKIKQI